VTVPAKELPVEPPKFGANLGCGHGEKAVVPVPAPNNPPKAVPMIGPKIPQHQAGR
jgi:hypothetical protein